MEILDEGKGELLGFHDPDEHRSWVAENKSNRLVDKRTSAARAVLEFIPDGAYIAFGGFGHVRIPMAIVYEMIRQKRRGLAVAGKAAAHELDSLIGAGCVERVEAAYAFGHELRGLSPASRRAVESGKVKVIAETSNAGYQWRFLAGMMGIPFIPARNLMGSDTLKHSSCKVARDPFTGKPITLIPACNPDAACIHVPRCDKFGNCQIDGILVEDFELARCARRLIITTEKIIKEDEIRHEPWKTVIPYVCVDAVVEVPFGSHPCQMPNMYYYDEEIIAEWLAASRSEEGAAAFFDKYVFDLEDFQEYLELVGGNEKLERLGKVERLEEQMEAPWLRDKRK